MPVTYVVRDLDGLIARVMTRLRHGGVLGVSSGRFQFENVDVEISGKNVRFSNPLIGKHNRRLT